MSGRLVAACGEEWRALVAFLRQPRRRPRGAARPHRRTAFILGAALPIALALVGVLLTLEWSLGLDLGHVLDGDVTAKQFVSAIAIAPVLEELLFRAGLRSLRYALLLGPAVAMVFAGSPWLALPVLIGGLVALAVVEARLLRRPGARVEIARRFLLRYPIVFWLWSGAFALVHVGNWQLATPLELALAPVVVVPQFLLGVALGYLRLTVGLPSAIAMHMAWNAILFAPLLLVP